ncbi:Peptidyl-prolyl cis-trans isomerase pin4 [Emydomyces testavorans]|uniref:Peptidyl-prolyl cis-trans isomerase pin4 n=1 Tax=Emydomyces testavorans TaxID=2070801 RepID=A0AAF0DEF8_9EURO|nr:Peptidyl-prolyl cis-trans isomerase pin4 [Emydomyces testavorans]
MYHNRSPGSHRHVHQPQQLHRRPSRQFDAYGSMSASLFDDPLSRYESSTLDRMNQGLQPNNFPYDITGSQTWNANGLGGAHTRGSIGANPLSTSTRGRANVRGRTGLPTTWLDQQPNPISSAFPLAPGPIQQNPLRPENVNHNHNHDGEDELIPTAIVIKNIPFAVKKEQLIQLMTEMNLPLPYAFNYHFDNGVFRGLAFANFTSAEETATVIEVLNHFDLNGRKLRVEYKKMLPAQERERIEREKRERRGQLEEQHRPMATSQLQNQTSLSSLTSHLPTTSPSPVSQRVNGIDMNDAQTLQFYSQMLLFKQDPTRESLIFPSTLTPLQRRTVHTLAHNMGLGHASRGTGEQRQVHVFRVAPGSNVSPPIPALPATIHPSESARRGLNRAATIDFSEARGDAPNPFGTLRGHNSGYLGVLDSPGAFGAAQNLRAAKSFADLRSYTPSPAPSTASYPAVLHANGTRLQTYEGATSGNSNTPTLTPTPGSSIGFQRTDDNLLVNSLGGLTLGTTVGAGNASSPRRLRSMFSWEQQEVSQSSATAPIGSNRSIGLGGFDTQAQERLPLRQPRGPAPERGSGFRRPNGHQSRSSDELQQGRPEIVVE